MVWTGLVAVMVVALGTVSFPGVARAGSTLRPVSVQRLSGNVYEYYYVVSTGADAHHRIGVHRVVEVANGKPIAAPDGVFLVHGDVWNFDEAFRGGRRASESIAVFLGSKGIDVWGVDLGWTLVPGTTTDFSFMRGWGLQRDINDVEKALAFARSVRARTGSSHSRLALLAWSRGGWLGYGLLNEESHKPLSQRQIRAFIPVDTYFKANNRGTRASVCALEALENHEIRTGTYADSNEAVAQVGANEQAALTLGAASFRFGPQTTPFYHFVAGVFPNGNIEQPPTGLVYTDIARFDHLLLSARPFEPSTMIRDTDTITCNPRLTTRFDDHLKDVTVPVLYVGAGGGFGRSGLYSLKLLGSKDVSSHIVSFFPPSKAAFDFGHVDLFYARRARQLVWTAPIPLADHTRQIVRDIGDTKPN